jgi:hypothetical protein
MSGYLNFSKGWGRGFEGVCEIYERISCTLKRCDPVTESSIELLPPVVNIKLLTFKHKFTSGVVSQSYDIRGPHIVLINVGITANVLVDLDGRVRECRSVSFDELAYFSVELWKHFIESRRTSSSPLKTLLSPVVDCTQREGLDGLFADILTRTAIWELRTF